MATEALALDGVDALYGESHVLHGVSFALGEGSDFGSFRIRGLRCPRTRQGSKDVGDHRRFEPDLSSMHFLDGL